MEHLAFVEHWPAEHVYVHQNDRCVYYREWYGTMINEHGASQRWTTQYQMLGMSPKRESQNLHNPS